MGEPDGDVAVADLMLWQCGDSPNDYSANDLAERRTYFTGSLLAVVAPVS